MLSLPTEVLPKSVAFGLGTWGLFSFFVLGPEVGARIAEVDHFPVCQTGYTELVHRAAERQKDELTKPTAGADAALAISEGIFGELGGLGNILNDVLAEARTTQRAVRERYQQDMAEIEASTRRKLANSDGFCGCVADAAIDKSRNDWALYAGSFGLLSGSKIENFGEAMTNPDNLAQCAGTAKVGQ